MTYRCPVDPQGCPTAGQEGYCEIHFSEILVPDREEFAKPVEEPTVTAEAPRYAVRLLGRTFPVPPSGLRMGREVEPFESVPGMAELTQVGRFHAELYWLGSVLYINDNKSLNGTYVDGRRLTTSQRITPGQALRLGLDVDVELIESAVDEHGLPL